MRNTLRMQRIVQMRAAIIEGGGKHRDAIRRNRGNGTTLNAQGSHLLTISIVGRFGGGLTSCWPGQSYTRHLASTKKGR